MLGRVLDDPPETGRALEELARPNPCLEHLTDARISASVATLEDAQDLGFGGNARAQLGAFGFSGEADRATHFVYRIETDRRVARMDGQGYAECCAQKGCGYGFIAALVHGEGEFAAAEETQGKISVDVTFAAAEGHARLSVLKRRHVSGWVASLIRVTDAKHAAAALGPLGAGGPHDDSVADQVKALYAQEKISVVGAGGNGAIATSSTDYVFKDSRGEITESEFVRRYRSVTGSTELDKLEGGHSRGLLIGGAAAFAVGGALLLYGVLPNKCEPEDADLAKYPNNCSFSETQNPGWEPTGRKDLLGRPTYYDPNENEPISGFRFVAVIFGPLLMTGGTVMTILSLTRSEGTPTSHWLGQYDAYLYAQRYNRAVLRRAARDVQRSYVSSNTPSVGIAFIGNGLALHGTF